MIAETSRLSRLVDGLLAVARRRGCGRAPEHHRRRRRLRRTGRGRGSRSRPNAVSASICATARAAPPEAHPDTSSRSSTTSSPTLWTRCPPGGTVRLDVLPSQTTTTVRVADDGPGMNIELREHAFDRFVSDRHGDGGTGLGLAIVGRLVAADHGSAELLETDGGGLTVEIRFPTAEHR